MSRIVSFRNARNEAIAITLIPKHPGDVSRPPGETPGGLFILHCRATRTVRVAQRAFRSNRWLPVLASRQQTAQFRFRQVAPAAGFESSELDVDDARALQATHVVAEHLTHAADLAVEALGQNNPAPLLLRKREKWRGEDAS